MSCTGVPRLDRLMIKIAPGMKTWCKVRRLGPANGLLQNCNTKEYKALPEASVQYLWNGLVWLLPVMCFQYLPMLRYLFLRCRPAVSATCTLLKTSCDTLPAWPVKATSESNQWKQPPVGMWGWCHVEKKKTPSGTALGEPALSLAWAISLSLAMLSNRARSMMCFWVDKG